VITDPNDFEPARPVYGILSIAAPFLGFALAIILCGILCGYPRRGPGSPNLEVFGYLVVIMPIAFLVGTVLAIVALRRRERFRALPVVGLVFNLGPLLLGVASFFL
jgi:hypothetical protein